MNVKLSSKSEVRLSQVHPDLQKVIREAFNTMPFDVTVLEGLRSNERQAELFKSGASKVRRSKHQDGVAVDIAPYPIDWNDKNRFNEMAKHVLIASKSLGIPVRWGGDWNMNGDWKDESFYDGPHFELI